MKVTSELPEERMEGIIAGSQKPRGPKERDTSGQSRTLPGTWARPKLRRRRVGVHANKRGAIEATEQTGSDIPPSGRIGRIVRRVE